MIAILTAAERRLIRLAQGSDLDATQLKRVRLLIHHPNRRIAGLAIEAIRKVGSRGACALPDLLQFLRSHKTEKVGAKAARCIRELQIEREDIYETLREAADTPNGVVNKECRKALQKLFSATYTL